MTLIDALKAYCKTLDADYKVEYERAAGVNLTADYIDNTKGLIWIEEVKSETRTVPTAGASGLARFWHTKTTPIDIYFCRFSTTLEPNVSNGDTERATNTDVPIEETTEYIRELITNEVVMPFMNGLVEALKAVSYKPTTSTFEITYPISPQLDANEVGVRLHVSITQRNSCPIL